MEAVNVFIPRSYNLAVDFKKPLVEMVEKNPYEVIHPGVYFFPDIRAAKMQVTLTPVLFSFKAKLDFLYQLASCNKILPADVKEMLALAELYVLSSCPLVCPGSFWANEKGKIFVPVIMEKTVCCEPIDILWPAGFLFLMVSRRIKDS